MAGLPSEIIDRSKELLLKFSSDKMKDESNLDNDKKQLDLFKYENKLIKKLKSIDLNKISPIESLIFLNELKNEINDN